MLLAPFWPVRDIGLTETNWPRWLKLEHIKFEEIDQDGIHLKVVFADGSYDTMVISKDTMRLAQTRMAGKAFYEYLERQSNVPIPEREKRVRFLNTKGSAGRKSAMYMFGPRRCPAGFIFDIERFQIHGPKHFGIIEHKLYIKPETLNVIRPIKTF